MLHPGLDVVRNDGFGNAAQEFQGVHVGTNPAGQANKLRATVAKGLPAGMYYVRVYGPDPELLREYGFPVGN